MLSQSGEYVLRVVVFLASEGGVPCTTHQIALATRVPEGYLAKLLQALGRAGLVHSRRGLHGGFVLTRRPDELTVYDVLAAVDPPQRIRSCPLGIESHSDRLCALHQRLDEAMAMVEEAFRKSTIADVVNEPANSRPLCPIPQTPRKSQKARSRQD